MTKDPFEILGIGSDSSEDEIKSAYRKLAKKYHPDLHPDDPNAEQHMREINEAYTQALHYKKHGYYQSTPGSGQSSGGSNYYSSGSGFGFDPFAGFGFSPFGSQYTYNTRSRNYSDPELENASRYVLSGRYNEALTLLNKVTYHSAEWCYIYAQACLGLGNRISALEYARQAVDLDPNDPEYRSFLSQLEYGSGTYRSTQARVTPESFICNNPCLSCCFLNALCNCCCCGRC